MEIIEVTCAVIIYKSKVLVTLRSESMPHPYKWEFPGGKVKVGESPEKCIKREINEELGVKIRVEQLLPSVKHTYSDSQIKLMPFICTIAEGSINLSEHDDYKWIEIDHLRELDWLEADLKILDTLEQYLQSTA